MVTKHGYSETVLFGASENLSFQPQVSKRVSTEPVENLQHLGWYVSAQGMQASTARESDGAGHAGAGDEVVEVYILALLRLVVNVTSTRVRSVQAMQVQAAAMCHKVFVEQGRGARTCARRATRPKKSG